MSKTMLKNGNYFLLLDYQDNKRVALRLSDTPDMELIPKYPELVDIKLTDVCHIKCPWCYQNSTSEGKHGDLQLIKNVIKSLNPKLTEVAYGGGDVLQHPNIVEILQFSRECGLTSSNITMNWRSIIKYQDKVKAVIPHLDAIGISITGIGQIKQVVETLKALDCYIPSRICFHIIPDLYSDIMIMMMLDELRILSPESDILFLGYKAIGRGVHMKPKHIYYVGDILKYIQKNNISLQCDTKFIKDYLDVVKTVASELTYDIQEGEYSMNIDCVEGFYSQSSYNLEFTGPITDDFDIVKAFQSVRKYGKLPIYKEEM